MPIAGVTSTELVVHADVRGSFSELFRQGWFGDGLSFVQANVSRSAEGVLRGMHFHRRQADLWIPLAGRLIPGLTTVHVPIHEFGSVASRMLLEQIETGVLTPRRVVFAPQLVVRGSSVAGADEQMVGRPAQRSPAE